MAFWRCYSWRFARDHSTECARLSLYGVFSTSDDLSGVVSFRKQARQVGTVEHEERSDVLVGHHSERVVDCRFRADRPDLSALLLQNLRHSIKYLHMITPSVTTRPLENPLSLGGII